MVGQSRRVRAGRTASTGNAEAAEGSRRSARDPRCGMRDGQGSLVVALTGGLCGDANVRAFPADDLRRRGDASNDIRGLLQAEERRRGEAASQKEEREEPVCHLQDANGTDSRPRFARAQDTLPMHNLVRGLPGGRVMVARREPPSTFDRAGRRSLNRLHHPRLHPPRHSGRRAKWSRTARPASEAPGRPSAASLPKGALP